MGFTSTTSALPVLLSVREPACCKLVVLWLSPRLEAGAALTRTAGEGW